MLNDVLGPTASKELSEEIGMLIENIRILGWRDLRGWNEFFAVFKMPQWNRQYLEQRMITNFLHYRSNYAIICLISFGVQLLLAPFVILSLVLISSGGYYLFVIQKGPIRVGDFILDHKAKQILFSVLSVLFVAFTGTLQCMLWGCLTSIFLCGTHMLFRPRSVTSKVNKFNEELKLNGFNWFSGSYDGSIRESEDLEDPRHNNDDDITMTRKRNNVAPGSDMGSTYFNSNNSFANSSSRSSSAGKND